MEEFGLQPLPEDKRDFKLGAIFFLPDLKDLPESFSLATLKIKNQGGSDFCSAYATCGISELQEGVELFPPWSFAVSKAISGDPEVWGQNMRAAFKGHIKHGAIETSKVDEKVKRMSEEELRYIENYPDYFVEAEKHRKKSFFRVQGRYDSFDDIRAAIWHFREKKQAVAIGLSFSWPLTQYILDGELNEGFGHMMYIIGWDPNGLIVVNSYGQDAGVDGFHRVKRETINQFADRYGAMMLVDEDPDIVRIHIERATWTKASFFGKLFILIKKFVWLS